MKQNFIEKLAQQQCSLSLYFELFVCRGITKKKTQNFTPHIFFSFSCDDGRVVGGQTARVSLDCCCCWCCCCTDFLLFCFREGGLLYRVPGVCQTFSWPHQHQRFILTSFDNEHKVPKILAGCIKRERYNSCCLNQQGPANHPKNRRTASGTSQSLKTKNPTQTTERKILTKIQLFSNFFYLFRSNCFWFFFFLSKRWASTWMRKDTIDVVQCLTQSIGHSLLIILANAETV